MQKDSKADGIASKDVIPLVALSTIDSKLVGSVLRGMLSEDACNRYEFMGKLLEAQRKSAIARKAQESLMNNLAVQGETDIACRERFIRRLENMARKDFIGLLGAKVRCMEAERLGAGWVREDERALKYLDLDHVSLLMGNTMRARVDNGK